MRKVQLKFINPTLNAHSYGINTHTYIHKFVPIQFTQIYKIAHFIKLSKNAFMNFLFF